MTENPRRPLTTDERRILDYIRDLYGAQNTENEVFFSDNDEAVIFVTDTWGGTPIMVVLTNVALTQADDNLSKVQVCQQHLLPPGTDLFSQWKIRDLTGLSEGLHVSHDPNPARARADDGTSYRYTWTFETRVEAIDTPVEIEEFGCFHNDDDSWIFSNVGADPFSKARFTEWYACPGGILEPGTACVDPDNWFGRDELCPGEILWYYVGRHPDGERVWGAAKLELLGELDDRRRQSD